MSIETRLKRLEDETGLGDGWIPFDIKPSPEIQQWIDELRALRDSYPTGSTTRAGSIMDMLGPEFQERVKKAGEEFNARHEWRWIDGQCYIRELS